jgi:hypothetical protein
VVIARLHDYEELRYPDDKGKGMSSMIDILRSSQLPPVPELGPVGGTTVPHYELCLQNIDELVEAIFVVASRNPKAYLRPFKPEAREYLGKDNRTGLTRD